MGFFMPHPPRQSAPPPPPDPNGTEEDQARRRSLETQARAGGRQGTIMTDYALATVGAPTLRSTLGGA